MRQSFGIHWGPGSAEGMKAAKDASVSQTLSNSVSQAVCKIRGENERHSLKEAQAGSIPSVVKIRSGLT